GRPVDWRRRAGWADRPGAAVRAFTVSLDTDRAVEILPGMPLAGGRFPFSQMLPTAELIALHGAHALVPRTTPYRRLDPTAELVDLGPEVLPDVRALVLLDGRGVADGTFFSFVHTADTPAGVQRLFRVDARPDQRGRAQMVELVVLLP